MKTLKTFFKNLTSGCDKKGYYAKVKCSDCGEEVSVRLSKSSDFQIEYGSGDNPAHFYTIKKEIIGKNCFNLMNLHIALTKNLKVLFVNSDSCEFIEFIKG